MRAVCSQKALELAALGEALGAAILLLDACGPNYHTFLPEADRVGSD
jgi:hypothetical protein